MSTTSRQSPLPPPQSPLVALGEEKLRTQLELEEKLRVIGEELLEVYKNSRQWKQVSQIAQALNFNSERITCIQDCLTSSPSVFELPSEIIPPPDPINAPLSTTLPGQCSPVREAMVEDPYDDFLSVKKIAVVDDNAEDSHCWEIKSKQYTKGEKVVRTPKDLSLLLRHLCKGTSKTNLLSNGADGEVSPDSFRQVLISALEDSVGGQEDLSLLQCFLSPKVNNFSTLVADIESLQSCDDPCHSERQTSSSSEISKQIEPNDGNQSGSDTINGNESELQHEINPIVNNSISHSITQNGYESKNEDEPHSSVPTSDKADLVSDSCADEESNRTKDQRLEDDDRQNENEPVGEENGNESTTVNIENGANTEEGDSKNEPNEKEFGNEPETEQSGNEANTEHSGNEPKTEHSESEPNTEQSGNEPNAENSGNDPKTEQSGNESNTEQSGNEPNTEQSGNESNTEQSGNEPNTEQSENEPNTENSGNDPKTEQSRNESNTEQSGNEPNTEQSGNGNDDSTELLNVTTEQQQTIGNKDTTIENEDPADNVANEEKTAELAVVEENTAKESNDNSSIEGTAKVAGDETVVSEGTPADPQVQMEDPDNENNAGQDEVPTNSGVTKDAIMEDTVADIEPEGSVDQSAVLPPSKASGIQITSASQLFIKSAGEDNDDDEEVKPKQEPPITSDDNTPTDFESSEGVLSRSEDHGENSDSKNVEKEGSDRFDTACGNSTFFVGPDRSKLRDDSPKVTRRGKSQSVFYTRTSESPPPDQDKSKLAKKLKRSFKRHNKIKKESSSDAANVSLMAPQLATSWDPTCILEELYSDCHPVVPQSSTGESSRFAGYLDKLPVNQSKPAVMKGWKHRYFKVTRGSLFYYDDERAQKAISFVRLTDAKIVLHQESLKVEINEKNGNFIFLRAETKQDVLALHRALQLESVHPTLTHRLSLSPSRAVPTIILDIGSCSIRAGLLNDNNYPQLFFPNVCAFNSSTLVACGSDSLLPATRGECKLVYPRRYRSRMDSTVSVRECFTAIIEDICKRLDIKPENCNILASVSSIMPEMEQQILAEIILEMLGFQGLLIQEQTTLSLYSYNCTTGISVNVGDTISVVPIIDGYKVEGADQHIALGGSNVSENLSKLASARDVRYFSDTEMYIVRHIKESLCFVSQDYLEDAEKCEQSPHEYTRAVDVDRFQLPDHKKVIALDLALFKAPEGLFQPAIWGKDVDGVHEMIHRSIEQCPIDLKREMCRHIYLSGGTSLLTGFPERLKSELSKLYPRMEIVIHGDEGRYHAAYLGACVLASLSTFQKSLVTPDDWISDGFDAFRKTDR